MVNRLGCYFDWSSNCHHFHLDENKLIHKVHIVDNVEHFDKTTFSVTYGNHMWQRYSRGDKKFGVFGFAVGKKFNSAHFESL